MEKVLVDVLMAIYQNPDPLLYPNTEPEHTSVETKVGGHKFRYTVLLSLPHSHSGRWFLKVG